MSVAPSDVSLPVTPAWLLAPAAPPPATGRRRAGAIDRSLAAAARVARAGIEGDDLARRPGVLQRLDARAALAGAVAALVGAGLVHHAAVLAGIALVALLAGWASSLPPARLVRRAWLALPVATAVVAVPAATSAVTPGHAVVPLGTWFGHHLALTTPGLVGLATIVARVAASATIVVVVTTAIGWSRLLGGVRGLGAPRMFVMVLTMAHRYVLHLVQVVVDLYDARRSRVVRRAGGRSDRRFIAASAATLFGRAHVLSTEVHMAMTARGWTGHARTLAPRRLAARDIAWVLGCVGLAAAALVVDRVALG